MQLIGVSLPAMQRRAGEHKIYSWEDKKDKISTLNYTCSLYSRIL